MLRILQRVELAGPIAAVPCARDLGPAEDELDLMEALCRFNTIAALKDRRRLQKEWESGGMRLNKRDGGSYLKSCYLFEGSSFSPGNLNHFFEGILSSPLSA